MSYLLNPVVLIILCVCKNEIGRDCGEGGGQIACSLPWNQVYFVEYQDMWLISDEGVEKIGISSGNWYPCIV